MTPEERAELLSQTTGFSPLEILDVEKVLEMMPSLTLEVTCETEGEEGIQEGDVVTLHTWVTLKRAQRFDRRASPCPSIPIPQGRELLVPPSGSHPEQCVVFPEDQFHGRGNSHNGRFKSNRGDYGRGRSYREGN